MAEKRTHKNFTESECDQVYNECQGKCFLLDCEKEFKDKKSSRDTWHMSHIKSLNNAGSDDLNNIVLLCAEDNHRMGSNNLDDYCRENKLKVRCHGFSKKDVHCKNTAKDGYVFCQTHAQNNNDGGHGLLKMMTIAGFIYSILKIL